MVSSKSTVATSVFLSEDDVKKHLAIWLEQSGWQTKVAWGKARGVDVEATRGRERWIIEAKGQGSLQPMRVNYFIAMLGETLQRMSTPHAKYSIAMPDVSQFRGLWAGWLHVKAQWSSTNRRTEPHVAERGGSACQAIPENIPIGMFSRPWSTWERSAPKPLHLGPRDAEAFKALALAKADLRLNP